MKSQMGVIKSDYENNSKETLRSLLPLTGSNLAFENDTWYCDKKQPRGSESKAAYTLYFSAIPSQYRDISKYYALVRLSENIKLKGLTSEIWALSIFFNFIDEKYKHLESNRISKTLINEYEQYIRSMSYSKASKERLFTAINTLFTTLKGWKEMPRKKPVSGLNPFSRTSEDRKIEGKYIPEVITKQLDSVFKDERIPLHQRLLYWIPRSVPSRISEITGMNIECLKPSYEGNGHWVIFIPSWKQSGGYMQPEIRPIYLKEEGHGEYLINLLRQQQQVANSLQGELKDIKDQNLLFTYRHSVYDHNLRIKTNDTVHYKTRNIISIANSNSVSKMFNRICERYNVKDENNVIYKFTSHQLRHNGITDRIYEGFSIIEIRDMTGHKGEQMIVQSYIHTDNDKLKEKQRLVNSKVMNENNESPVYFKGKILNMDESQEARLLHNIRAHRIGRLGICSDITSCAGDLYECLGCDYFIPNADELDYFEEEVKQWSSKVSKFKNHKFMLENAEYNLELNEKIVEKIKRTQEEKEHEYA